MRCDLGSQRVYPYREPALHGVDLLIEGDDLLIEHADLAAKGVKLRRDDVLEGLLDLVVEAHRHHWSKPPPARQRDR